MITSNVNIPNHHTLDQLPNPIWLSGVDAKFTFFNKSWLEFTGKGLDQTVGNNWTDDIHPEDKEAFTKTYEESYKNKLSFRVKYRLRHLDGTFRWVTNSCSPFLDEQGNFLGYIGSLFDTDQDKEYLLLFANMTSGFAYHKIITNDQGKPIDYEYIDINNSFEEILGLKKVDVIGKTVTQLFPEVKNDPFDWIAKYGEVALGGKGVEFENYSTVLNKWFHVSAYSPKNRYFVTLFDDITSQKQAEKDLQKKLEEIEKTNELMTDRELKMIELKKHIEALEQSQKRTA